MKADDEAYLLDVAERYKFAQDTVARRIQSVARARDVLNSQITNRMTLLLLITVQPLTGEVVVDSMSLANSDLKEKQWKANQAILRLWFARQLHVSFFEQLSCCARFSIPRLSVSSSTNTSAVTSSVVDLRSPMTIACSKSIGFHHSCD